MKISRTMVKTLLGYVTEAYFDDHAEPPETVEDIADLVRNMRIQAERSGDLPWLKIALTHLLAGEPEQLAPYGSSGHRLAPAELSDLLFLVWQALWPGEALPAPGTAVELEPMEAQDWLAYRKAVYGA